MRTECSGAVSAEGESRAVHVLLAAAIAGAMLGALAAKLWLNGGLFDSGFRLIRADGSFSSQLLIGSLFPALILLADLSQRKAAYLFVFFIRSAAAACVLSLSFSCLQRADLVRLLGTMLFRCALPFPVFFFCAGRLLCEGPDAQGRRKTLLLLLPAAAELAACIAGLLLAR